MKQDSGKKEEQKNMKPDENAGINMNGHILIRDKETGEEITFYGKELQQLCEERPEIRKRMYEDTCEQYVMKYQHEDPQELDPDIEIDESGL